MTGTTGIPGWTETAGITGTLTPVIQLRDMNPRDFLQRVQLASWQAASPYAVVSDAVKRSVVVKSQIRKTMLKAQLPSP